MKRVTLHLTFKKLKVMQMKKMILITAILFPLLSFTQTTIIGFEYWFDNEVANKISTNVTSPSLSLTINDKVNTNSLKDGLHLINLRSWDNNLKYSSVITEFFYKNTLTTASNKMITAYEYWLDNYPKNINSVTPNTVLQLNAIVDFSAIQDGLHVFNLRCTDDAGNWSSVVTDFFYKKASSSITNKKMTAYQYWNDNDFANAVTENVTHAEIFNLNKTIDYSNLADGLHVFNIRFKDDTEKWTSITSDFYYKKSSNSFSNKNIIAYQVWMDNDFANAILSTASASQPIFNLNAALAQTTPLVNGLHTLHLRFKDDAGNWSAITSAFFIKKSGEIAPKKITNYQYWLNNDFEHAVDKSVSPSAILDLNTFILPSNLTTKNNILNFRFKDDSGEWSSIVSEAFEDITLATVDNTLRNVEFYPNPFEENLNINLGKNYHEISVEIYDFSGKLAYQQKFNNKNLLQLQLKLNSGVYQLILKADDKVTSRKILRR